MRGVLRAWVVALVVIGGALAASAGTPSPAVAIGKLPQCRLANLMTIPHDYDSWSTTLVDWLLRVPRNYQPPDLVPVSQAGIAGPGVIRAVAIDDLRALAKAAAANGTPISVNSPYRSYADQVASFNGWVGVDGYDDAITYSQRPGHSEHQLGLTIDFQTLNGGSALQGDWATTPSGAWMAANAWKYGWVMSYPKAPDGALFSQATCFHYEPWHYRYLGRVVARQVHRSGLTIREFLWRHYTMVDPVTGEALATPTPTPSPTPVSTPALTLTPGPTASGPHPSATTPAPTDLPGAPTDRGIDPLFVVGAVAAVAVGLGALVVAGRRRGSPG